MKQRMLSVAALGLALSSAGKARDFFVRPTGNDSSPGSQAQPFQSAIALKKAGLTAGDRVFFEAGRTFTAGVELNGLQGSPGRPILLTSWGKGRAIIAPASPGQNGLRLENSAHVELRGLAFVGAGRDASKANGILLTCSSTPCEQVLIDDCDVSGFNFTGLLIEAKGSKGWQNVTVTRSRLHHNRDMGIHSSADWLLLPRPNKAITIRDCKVYSNWGTHDSPNNMGGIVLMGVSGALIERCETYDNGGDYPYGKGVFGMWCWSSDHVVMQFNESHHNRQNGKGTDGGGFDLDGAVTDSLVQYNYSHDNDGAGVLLAQFDKANESGPFERNIIRYNVSERDAQRGNYGAITIWGAGMRDKIGRSEIYNNTVYVSPATRGGSPKALMFMDRHYKDISVYNNFFYTTAGIPLVDMPAGGDRSSLVLRNNGYWSEGGGFRVIWDGRDYKSLNAFAGAGAGKQEQLAGKTVGLNLDPLFQAPGQGRTISDLSLYARLSAYLLKPASPLRDRGLDLSKASGLIAPPGKRDYHGYPVPRGAGWDIGAHELPAPVPPLR